MSLIEQMKRFVQGSGLATALFLGSGCGDDRFCGKDAYQEYSQSTSIFQPTSCDTFLLDPVYQAPPAECTLEGTVTSTVGNTVFHIPREEEKAVKDHYNFLKSVTPAPVFEDLMGIYFYQERESCTPDVWDGNLGNAGFSDGCKQVFVNISTFQNPEELGYWESSIPRLPFEGADYRTLFPGSAPARFVTTHELGHVVHGHSPYIDVLEQEMIEQCLVGRDFNINTFFAEEFANTYAKILSFLADVRSPRTLHPVFEHFMLPSLEKGEVSEERVREFVNEEYHTGMPPYAENLGGEHVHDDIVDYFVASGLLNAQHQESLHFDNLEETLKAKYLEYQKNANRALDNL